MQAVPAFRGERRETWYGMDMFRETLHPEVVGRTETCQGMAGDHSCQGTSLSPPLELESVRLFPDPAKGPFSWTKGFEKSG